MNDNLNSLVPYLYAKHSYGLSDFISNHKEYNSEQEEKCFKALKQLLRKRSTSIETIKDEFPELFLIACITKLKHESNLTKYVLTDKV